MVRVNIDLRWDFNPDGVGNDILEVIKVGTLDGIAVGAFKGSITGV